MRKNPKLEKEVENTIKKFKRVKKKPLKFNPQEEEMSWKFIIILVLVFALLFILAWGLNKTQDKEKTENQISKLAYVECVGYGINCYKLYPQIDYSKYYELTNSIK